jgi:transposase
MRKSFCGLSGIVRSELGREPNDGSLFLFINRRKDRLKALYWDTDGMMLFYKLLESGTFERIESGDRPSVSIDAAELSMLLSGIDIQSARRRKRFRRRTDRGIDCPGASTDPGHRLIGCELPLGNAPAGRSELLRSRRAEKTVRR